jgi:hypothetical protein
VSFDAALEEFFTETVTLAPLSGQTLSQARSYGAAKSIHARIEQGSRLVRAADGREVVSQTRAFLKPVATDGSSFTPKIDDQLTLPAGYTPQQPPLIAMERHNDLDGLHHWVLHT